MSIAVVIGYRTSSSYLGWLATPLLVLIAVLLPGCAILDPRPKDPTPPGIARIETITIDGLPERLLLRGRDPIHNPLLLFIHGGLGFPAAPFRQVNSDLERSFTVVHWDQRGAGYSYFPQDITVGQMQVDQFVRETLVVSRHLCREFNQPKIYLVGHSWGTLPAILAAARAPQLFYAYVALDQLVDIDESARRLAAAALRRARDRHAWRQASELEALGPHPYRSLSDQDRARYLISRLSAGVSHQATILRLAALALTSRYYPLPELIRGFYGYQFSRRLLDPQLRRYDLRRLVPELKVPAYFFAGREDVTFGVSLQKEYFRALSDRRGKHFVLFQDSTHWPHIEQPAAFGTQMDRVRADIWPPSRR